MKYLESYHLTAFENYCRTNCTKIVVDHHSDEDKDMLDFYRGRYVGFIYGMRVAVHFKKMRRRVSNTELYNHLKIQKNSIPPFSYSRSKHFRRGVDKVLYDLMRYCSDDLIGGKVGV